MHLCLSMFVLATVCLLHLPPNDASVISLCYPLPWKPHGHFGLVLEIRPGAPLAAFIPLSTGMHVTTTLGSTTLHAWLLKPSPICL